MNLRSYDMNLIPYDNMAIVSGQVKRTTSAEAMSASCTIAVADLSGQSCATFWRGRSSISLSTLPTSDERCCMDHPEGCLIIVFFNTGDNLDAT